MNSLIALDGGDWKQYVVRSGPHPIFSTGLQAILEFPNGRSVSIVYVDHGKDLAAQLPGLALQMDFLNYLGWFVTFELMEYWSGGEIIKLSSAEDIIRELTRIKNLPPLEASNERQE